MKLHHCHKAIVTWSESQDHPVSLGARLGAWFHCLLCSPCRRYVKQTEFIRTTAAELHRDGNGAIGEKEDCPTLSSECRERMKKALKETQGGR